MKKTLDSAAKKAGSKRYGPDTVQVIFGDKVVDSQFVSSKKKKL
ncbi:hypothetical protein [Flagellimonas marina]|uniref:Uncharacterized protein n=1 Tax=Flagellimonas marina TaxID=1775168 RepID=A0ABV8PL95_9FLAO